MLASFFLLHLLLIHRRRCLRPLQQQFFTLMEHLRVIHGLHGMYHCDLCGKDEIVARQKSTRTESHLEITVIKNIFRLFTVFSSFFCLF